MREILLPQTNEHIETEVTYLTSDDIKKLGLETEEEVI